MTTKGDGMGAMPFKCEHGLWVSAYCSKCEETAPATPAMKDEVAESPTFAYPEHKPCVHCSLPPEDHKALPAPHFCPREDRKPFSVGGWRTTVYEPAQPMKDEVESATTELSQQVREQLWYSHGCVGIYGDDGEMQCSFRQPFIDFKRDSEEKILEGCRIHAMERFKLATAPATPTLKDEVYAMLAELPGQLCGETVRILMPHLEDAVKWRKR